jgi:hypothetical protein
MPTPTNFRSLPGQQSDPSKGLGWSLKCIGLMGRLLRAMKREKGNRISTRLVQQDGQLRKLVDYCFSPEQYSKGVQTS